MSYTQSTLDSFIPSEKRREQTCQISAITHVARPVAPRVPPRRRAPLNDAALDVLDVVWTAAGDVCSTIAPACGGMDADAVVLVDSGCRGAGAAPVECSESGEGKEGEGKGKHMHC